MLSSTKIYRITVVGGGIIGLTTACTLLKEYADDDRLILTIISEKFSPDTTADVSAGYWEPYGLDSSDSRILRWAGYTYNIFTEEFFSNKATCGGIIQMPSYLLRDYSNTSSEETKPEFSNLVRHFRSLDSNEMQMFSHLKAKSGFSITSLVVEPRKYLPLLQRFLSHDRRVRFIQRKIQSFEDLKDSADVIINCTGLASRHLVGDQTIRPARGQVIRVNAPWIKGVYVFDTDEGLGYIIPQSDTVVLGGTFQLNDWNENIDDEDTRKILRMCSKCLPALKDIQYGRVQVGLRPYRDQGVRLEHEKTQAGLNLIHNYGHSGAGVTLSWGCAKEVAEIVKNLLPPAVKGKNSRPEHEQLWRLIPEQNLLIPQAKL